MQTTLTLTLVAACCVGTVLTSPLRAQEGRAWYAPPASVYQAPGGGYPTLSDFSRDVWTAPRFGEGFGEMIGEFRLLVGAEEMSNFDALPARDQG
jgi:hypothetical protein